VPRAPCHLQTVDHACRHGEAPRAESLELTDAGRGRNQAVRIRYHIGPMLCFIMPIADCSTTVERPSQSYGTRVEQRHTLIGRDFISRRKRGSCADLWMHKGCQSRQQGVIRAANNDLSSTPRTGHSSTPNRKPSKHSNKPYFENAVAFLEAPTYKVADTLWNYPEKGAL
jgi:hypothetical protein